MQIQGAIALVTGANRGIGKAFVEALLESGATKIYAAARNVESLQDVVAKDPDRITPIALDVTNLEQIQALAAQAQDVNLLINNAGVLGSGGVFTPKSVEVAQWEMNTNYFGTLSLVREFAPILQKNGGGVIANILSVASIANTPIFGSYSASKAALFSLTQGIRAELAQQGTLVVGVFPGPVDTPMSAGIPLDKTPPIEIARATLKAVENQEEDVFPDPVSQSIFANLHPILKAIEKEFAKFLPQ